MSKLHIELDRTTLKQLQQSALRHNTCLGDALKRLLLLGLKADALPPKQHRNKYRPVR